MGSDIIFLSVREMVFSAGGRKASLTVDCIVIIYVKHTSQLQNFDNCK